MMRFSRAVFALLALALSASAGPLTWTLNGVTLSGGVTASGSFTFNPDAGTPCTTGDSPCGAFGNIDITTTAGGGLPAETFLYACGEDVASCTGLSPNSTQVLFLTSNAANQNGLAAIAFFFTGVGGVPPAGLTDAGGTIDVSNSNETIGAVEEALCADAACSGPSSPDLGSVAGSVTASAVPEPSSALLAVASLAGLGLVRLRGFRRSRRAS
jgi:hypothetical protein